MSGNSRMYDNASMYGNARMYDSASMSDSAQARSPVVFLSGFPHDVTITDHHIKVGCEQHPPSVWAERGAAIIRADGHSTEDARKWAKIINLLAEARGCTDPEREKENAG